MSSSAWIEANMEFTKLNDSENEKEWDEEN